ncbi:MAG: hypothetical protein ACOYI4_05435 [Christensenellales bacterium]
MNSQKNQLSENTVKIGWNQDEDLLLSKEIESAKQEGRPIKSVFQRVADATGRKPNSVRNYYYAKLKESGNRVPAFELFTTEEVKEMLTEILSAQAMGMSVRACTLRMGKGDNKAMLRYQNKYRSIIKNNPALVKETIEEMRKKNMPVFDPYASKKRENPLYEGELVDVLSGIVKSMQAADLNINSFFQGLYTLGDAAARGKKSLRKVSKYETEIDGIKKDREELVQRIHILQGRLEEIENSVSFKDSLYDSNRENMNRLLSMFRQLVKVNQDFLRLNSVVKVSSLSEYIADLGKQMEECEQALIEFAR